MFTHAGEDARLTLGSRRRDPTNGHPQPTWNGTMVEAHYTATPQFIVVGRYENIRISQQLFTASPPIWAISTPTRSDIVITHS